MSKSGRATKPKRQKSANSRWSLKKRWDLARQLQLMSRDGIRCLIEIEKLDLSEKLKRKSFKCMMRLSNIANKVLLDHLKHYYAAHPNLQQLPDVEEPPDDQAPPDVQDPSPDSSEPLG